MTTDTRRGNAVDNHIARLGDNVEEIGLFLRKANHPFLTRQEWDDMEGVYHKLTATVMRYRSNGERLGVPFKPGDVKEVDVHSIEGGYSDEAVMQRETKAFLRGIRRALVEKYHCAEKQVRVPKEAL